ncbi:CocE/NonD family hydrolase [Tunturiibacter gelidiferens]
MKISGCCAMILSGWLTASVAVLGAQEAQAAHKLHAITLSAGALDEYVGQYRDEAEPDVLSSVYREGDRLYIEGERSPRYELQAESADHFFAHQLRVVFVRDAAGKVSGLASTFGERGEPGVESKEGRVSLVGERLNHFREYTRSEAMIPMRDGVKLHVVILRPAGSETSGEALPFLMQRTPYGTSWVSSAAVNGSKPELAASGYVFVFGDIRGRYVSEGRFVMNRPIVAHTTKNDVDETTDTRDTIDWLLKNVPNNNGKVGVLGVSYPGFLAMSAGIDAHPAVKAISPQAPMTNVWMGDDFFIMARSARRMALTMCNSWRHKRRMRGWRVKKTPSIFSAQCELRRGCGCGEDGGSADGEDISDAACLYEVLAGYGGGETSDEGGGADARGGWMVGPGGPVGNAGRVCCVEAT